MKHEISAVKRVILGAIAITGLIAASGCQDKPKQQEEKQECRCPDGTPAAALHQYDIRRQFTHNSPPQQPNPVGSIKAALFGPAAGECCKDNAKFQVQMELSSSVLGNNNVLMAGYLCTAAFQVRTTDLGTGAVINCPAPAKAGCPAGGGNPGPNQVITLTAVCEIPVSCSAHPACACALQFNGPFKTEITLPGAGSLEVYWQVTLTNAADCVIRSASASITRIIDIRVVAGAPQVYDPTSQRYMPANADTDGDGKSNQQEVIEGSDPNRR
jgi:hypothetical protein